MAQNKSSKQLPRGISYRADKDLYMGRFTFEGKTYTFYDKDLKKITKTLEEKRYEIQHGLAGAADKISLDTWFSEWMSQYKVGTVKETSFNNYLNLYTCYVQPSLGKRNLKQIKPVHVQRLFNDLSQKGLSAGTLSSVKALLSAVFLSAVQNDLVVKSACTGVKLPAAKVEEPRVLTVDEQGILLDYVRRERWQTYEPLITVMLATGLRLGEALALSWDNVSFESKELIVDKTLVYVKDINTGLFVFKFQSPKSEAGKRTIPLVKEAVDALQRQRVAQMKLRLAMGPKWKSVEGFELLAFTTSHGTPLQETTVRKMLVKVVAEINEEEAARAQEEGREPFVFEHIHPHTLRHSFATRAIECGMVPKALQRILGHSKLELTMNLYVHATAEQKRTNMDLLEGIFSA